MKALVWFIGLAVFAGVLYSLWRMKAKWDERSRVSQERFASFMAQALPGNAATPKPVHDDSMVQQRLLLEAAHKAGEANEPALAIQLYAKLLSRYPQTSFAAQARAAVDAQKKKLVPRPS